jgi:hypothetical protein
MRSESLDDYTYCTIKLFASASFGFPWGMIELVRARPKTTRTSALRRTPSASQHHRSTQVQRQSPTYQTELYTMGNDGGSIPKRSELVKEAAKALTTAQIKEAQTEQQEYAWSTDPLTRKPLARPVVSDAAGVLYNKDSIIEFLLKEEDDAEKAEMKKVGGVKDSELGTFGDRVKGLKDVVEVQKTLGEKWKCPITGERLGLGSKAVYIVPCGHAFAGSVVKEVAENVCLTVCINRGYGLGRID